MTASSVTLAIGGLVALFAPDTALAVLGSSAAAGPRVALQLLGALYYSAAVTNWTARQSAMGGTPRTRVAGLA